MQFRQGQGAGAEDVLSEEGLIGTTAWKQVDVPRVFADVAPQVDSGPDLRRNDGYAYVALRNSAAIVTRLS